PIGCMFRRVHAVGYGHVTRYPVAEADMIEQNAADIGMAKQAPARIVAVSDGAVLAHGVIGGALVTQNAIGPGVPILLQRFGHTTIPVKCKTAAQGSQMHSYKGKW